MVSRMIVAIAFSIGACGTEEMPHPQIKSPHSADEIGWSGGEVDEDQGGGSDEENGGTDSVEAALVEQYRACGEGELDAASPTPVTQKLHGLTSTRLGSMPILGGLFHVNYEVAITPGFELRLSPDQAVASSAFVTTTDQALAATEAADLANRLTGAVTVDLVAPRDRLALKARDPAWDGVFCTIRAATQNSASLGSGTTVVTFDPPLPAFVPPTAAAAVYDSELAKARAFGAAAGIKATIVSTTNPNLQAGQVIAGTASVTAIEKTMAVDLGKGNPINVGGDIAFELKVDFGGAVSTLALGLWPSTRFFIDTTSRSYKAIVANLNDGVTPPLVMVVPTVDP